MRVRRSGVDTLMISLDRKIDSAATTCPSSAFADSIALCRWLSVLPLRLVANPAISTDGSGALMIRPYIDRPTTAATMARKGEGEKGRRGDARFTPFSFVRR